jgi:hypothetical protein
MAIKLLEWLSRNALRSFPIREDTTAVSPAGFSLPNDLLVDAIISVPGDDTDVCVGAVCLTPRIVTVVLVSQQTGETLGTATAFPGATDPYSSIAIVPAIDGVAGFLTFGPFIENGINDALPGFAGSHVFFGRPVLESRWSL